MFWGKNISGKTDFGTVTGQREEQEVTVLVPGLTVVPS